MKSKGLSLVMMLSVKLPEIVKAVVVVVATLGGAVQLLGEANWLFYSETETFLFPLLHTVSYPLK